MFDHRGRVAANNLLFRTDFSSLRNVFFRLFSSLGWWISVVGCTVFIRNGEKRVDSCSYGSSSLSSLVV